MPAIRTVARAALLLALGLSAATVTAADKRKVILDDDGFGIAEWMVVLAPDVEVLGVTQVTGNDWVKVGVANSLRALERAGRTDIPVIPGATYPLLNTEKRTELWEQLYGRLVWKGAWHKEWVEPTEQSLPEYHGPDEMPETLPWGKPETEAADDETGVGDGDVHEIAVSVTALVVHADDAVALVNEAILEVVLFAGEVLAKRDQRVVVRKVVDANPAFDG